MKNPDQLLQNKNKACLKRPERKITVLGHNRAEIAL